jgi:hypothetical protein
LSSEQEGPQIRLEREEEAALFALLKGQEERLPALLRPLLLRLERQLYGRLTIEELERLQSLYRPKN